MINNCSSGRRAARYLFLVAFAMHAAPAGAQPVDSLVRRALAVHPSVAAAQRAIAAVDARARGAGAWAPPTLAVDFRQLPLNDPNPFAKGETMVMAEQAIPLFGQNRVMADAARRGEDVAQAELAGVRRDLRARVEREYFALWLLDGRAALTAESRKHTEILYQAAETRYLAGRSPQSDLLRMNIEIESLTTELKEIQEEHGETLARLNLLLMLPVTTPIAVDDDLPSADLPPFDSLALRLAGHPGLRRMEAMAAAMRAEAAVQEAMLKPMLMVRGGLEFMPEGHPVREGNLQTLMNEPGHEDGSATMRFGLAAGATLTIPIAPWARSGPEGLAEANRLDAEGQLFGRDTMLQELTSTLRMAYGQAKRARLRMQFYRTAQLPLLERSLATTVEDYSNGRVPLASVIDVEHMMQLAHIDLYMQQIQYALALSTITELTGFAP